MVPNALPHAHHVLKKLHLVSLPLKVHQGRRTEDEKGAAVSLHFLNHQRHRSGFTPRPVITHKPTRSLPSIASVSTCDLRLLTCRFTCPYLKINLSLTVLERRRPVVPCR